MKVALIGESQTGEPDGTVILIIEEAPDSIDGGPAGVYRSSLKVRLQQLCGQFAVNGKLNSAEIYPSNGLFRKMWPKLLGKRCQAGGTITATSRRTSSSRSSTEAWPLGSKR